MHIKMMVLSFAGLILLLANSVARADVKAAAGILKSTVVIEWTGDTKVDSKKPLGQVPKESDKGSTGSTDDAAASFEPAAPSNDLTQQFTITAPIKTAPKQTIAINDVNPFNVVEERLQVVRATRVRTRTLTAQIVAGSGVIIDSNGLIITSLELGQGGKISVSLEDGRKFPATRTALDQRSGLSLLKVDAQDLPAVQLSLDPLEVGQDVVAGLSLDSQSRALARGIVSGKNRSVTGPCAEVIQTDVSTSALSMGAPLVNGSGQLIGILTRTDETPTPGLSYAVPARFIKLLLDARPAPGEFVIRKGYLGVQLGNQDGGPPNVVQRVFEGAPAAKAGLLEKDEIVQIDGVTIHASPDVIRAVSQHKGGDKIKVDYRRGGKSETIEIVLGEYPQSQGPPVGVNVVEPSQVWVWAPNAKGDLELTLQTLHPKDVANPALKFTAVPPMPIALHNLVLPAPPVLRTPLAVRDKLQVERSDLNQKLDELKGQVDGLKTEVSKLTKIMELLEKKLTQSPQ